MATAQPITRSYNGKVSAAFFKEVVGSAATLEGGFANLVTGIKGRINIPDFTLKTGLKRREECTTEEAGEFGMNNNIIEVCPLEINMLLCHAKYTKIYDDQSPYEYTLPGAIERFVPEEQNRILMELVVKNTKNEIEQIIWGGDNTFVGNGAPADVRTLCDGWLKRLSDSPDTVVFGPLAGGISSANIIDLLQEMFALMPVDVFSDPGYADKLTFYLPMGYKRYMNIAMLEFAKGGGAAPITPTENRDVWLWMNSYPIVFTTGFDENGNDPYGSGFAGIFTHSNNLWVGTDLVSDIENFSVKNLTENDPSNRNTRVYGGFNLGTQVWRPGNVVAYSAI